MRPLRKYNISGDAIDPCFGDTKKVNQLCLYILCGLPFAGKSTLAGELAKTLSAAYVQLDAINGERGLGLDGKRISSVDWDETYRIAYQRVESYLRQGIPITPNESTPYHASLPVLDGLAAPVHHSKYCHSHLASNGSHSGTNRPALS